MATPIEDGLVDSPFGRVRPEILDILNGGQGAPAPTSEPVQGAPEAAPEADRYESAAVADPVDPNSITSSVGRSYQQMEAAGGGLIETAGQITGSQYLTDLGQSIRETNLEQASAYGTPEYASTADITDPFDMDQVGSFLKNMTGSVAPQLAVVGTGSALLAKAPGLAGLIGKGAAAATGAFLTSFGLNTGNMQVELKQLDPQGEHPMSALAFGSAAGVLDAVGFGLMAKPLMKYISPETIYMHALASGIPARTALDGLKSVAAGTAIGAVTGGATDAAQAVIAGETTDKPYSIDDIITRGVDSAFGGSIGGAAIRGGGEIADRLVQNAIAPGSAVDPSQLSSSSPKEHGLLNKFLDNTMREATAPLEPLARVSPEMENLIRDFRPDMSGQKATGETVHERYEILSGTLHTKFNDVIGKKSQAEQEALLRDLDQAKPTTEEGAKVRAVLDETWDLADKAGLQVGRVEGYTPYSMDADLIRNNRPEFEADLAKSGYDNPAALVDDYLANIDNPREVDAVPNIDQLVQPGMTPDELKIMSQFTMKGDPNTMRGKFAQSSVPPKNVNLEMSRSFSEMPAPLRNKWIKETTAKEKVGAINDYLHGAAHRVAFAERFGPSGEVLNARIAKAVYEAQQAGRSPTKGEISQIYGIADAYNGMYKRVSSAKVRNAMAIGTAALNMKTLPFAAIMSLTEFGTPMLRFNVADTMMSVGPAVYQLVNGTLAAAFKKIPRSDWAKLAGEAGVDWNSTQNLVGERLGATAYNRTAAKATRLFFLANGLSALTHAQRTLGGLTGKRVFDSNLQLLASGLDFSSARGAKALNELRSLGVDVRTRQDAEALYSPKTPSQVFKAREVERLVVRRASNQTVLEPTSSDLPLWMSNGYAAPLAQLKRYPTAYSNIILPQLLRRNRPSYQGSYAGATAAAMGTAFTVGLMFYMGMTQDYLSRYAKAGFTEPEDSRTEEEIIFDVANRTFSPMSLQYLTGMYGSNRYGQGPIESQLGPWAGVVGDAMKATQRTINSFEDDPTSGHIWQFLFKQTPFGPVVPLKEMVKGD